MSLGKDYKQLKRCRICKSKNLIFFLNFGPTPLPNKFLRKEGFKREKFYPLEICFCQDCGLVQLKDVVDPDQMFKNYAYITPSSARMMMDNFSSLSYFAQKKLNLNNSSLVVDIGSNDGSLLEFFKNLETRVLGVDPALNLTKLALAKGIPTETGYFDLKMAKKISSKYGQASLITATNVCAHIDDLDELFRAVGNLLKDDGLFITEFPYLLDLITKNQFDTIYHEHLSYFSLKPWQILVKRYGFGILDIQRLSIHGGSIRITHTKLSAQSEKLKVQDRINHLLNLEYQNNLYQLSTYKKFSRNILKSKKNLVQLLLDLKKDGKTIVGLGAAAKGNILTNVFMIGPEILNYIADSTPQKHGLFTPGMHIPIFPEEKVIDDIPDFALILAWNFADEIMNKYKSLRKKGLKFIIPAPEVRIS